MLFSVRLVSHQPDSMSDTAWQEATANQLATVKSLRDAGTIKSIYRETGVGVLAIFDVSDPQQMDQELRGLPMFRYFESITVHALWDMAPALEDA